MGDCTAWISPRASGRSRGRYVVIVIQDDIFNDAGYPSTLVVPTTTKLVDTGTPLRLRVLRGTAGLDRDSDVLVAQAIAVANESFRDRQLRLVLGLWARRRGTTAGTVITARW